MKGKTDLDRMRKQFIELLTFGSKRKSHSDTGRCSNRQFSTKNGDSELDEPHSISATKHPYTVLH